MTALQAILDALSSDGLEPLGEIIPGEGDTPTFYISVLVSRDAAGKQVPSNRRLHEIKKELSDKGVSVHFLLRYSDSEQVEAGLRATLLHSHIEHIRNIFASFDSAKANVWIEPKRALNPQTISEIHSRSQEYLKLVGLKLGVVSLTTDEVLPSKLAILTIIRAEAPVAPQRILELLSAKGLSVPSMDWLSRQLDAYRKSGDVVRLATGSMALTKKALHVLGTKKNRASPDISRLLAMARGGR